MTRFASTVAGAALLVAAAGCRTAASRAPGAPPEPARRPDTSAAQAPGGPGGAGGPSAAMAGAGGTQGDPAPRPYARIITTGARTREGMFKTHRVGSKLFFEIPRRELGRDMLLVTQIAKTTLGVGYGGEQIGDRVLRWERRDHRVLLRAVNYNIVADTSLPIAQAVAASNYHPIVAAFNVEAYGPDSAAVIDVTRLYTSGTAEFGVGNRIRGSFDASRAFIERVASFPTNVEVEATHTYNPPPAPPLPQDLPVQINLPPSNSQSVLMHWSMVRLPERPMMPRLEDRRVGYFTIDQLDFGTSEQRAARRSYITRYRLEKKNPGDSISEPVKPIVYYVDPATPRWLVPFIKRGIEAWQPAFEAAGFRNAIVARDAPSPAEDPDWSPEDARYSVIRWLPSTVENAVGPNVVDPRSGEIIEADVLMYHNIMNLQRAWYFTQAAPLDPRAQRLPFPDSLMGQLVEYVVAHEVGHTLGFPHNMKASSTYDADSVRSRSFVERMGHTPTLMDYARFNYVAQPEDSIDAADLIPKIGPYDKYAVMWGYKPIPEAKSPEEERPTLDRWARMQDTAAYLRFSTSNSLGADPGEETEAVGDADAVKSTALGLRNIKRVMALLEPATAKPGENYDDLSEMYNRTLDQWVREMQHVANVVGGAESQEKYVGQEGPRFTPLSRARQQAAVRFLNEHAFRTPAYFLDAGILRKIEPEGSLDRVGRAQQRVLAALLDNSRIARLIEYEALSTTVASANGAKNTKGTKGTKGTDGASRRARASDVYKPGDMLLDVRRGVWAEIYAGRPQIDAFRRRLQRTYLETVAAKVNPVHTPPTRVPLPNGGVITLNQVRNIPDARPLLRGDLVELDRDLARALARTTDRTTRLHLQDARTQIERILDPER